MITNLKLYPSLNHWGLEGLEVKVFTNEGEFSAKTQHAPKESMLNTLSYRRARPIFSALRKHIIAKDESKWRDIDSLLLKADNTGRFRKIGGNLALAVSIASARAGTKNELWKITDAKNPALPVPAGRIISGKTGGASDWLEFLAIPANPKNPYKAIKTLIDFWSLTGEMLKEKKALIGKDLSHAWISKLDSRRNLSLLRQLSKDYDLKLGVNFGSHRLWNGKGYEYMREGRTLSTGSNYNLVLETAKKYNLYYLEDPFCDSKSFEKLKKQLPKSLIAGNQIYYNDIGNAGRLMARRLGNAAVLNPSYLGLLSIGERFASQAKKNSMHLVCSGSYIEPADHWLADIAVAFGCPLMKTGITGPDIQKHNRLIELWEHLPSVSMAGLP